MDKSFIKCFIEKIEALRIYSKFKGHAYIVFKTINEMEHKSYAQFTTMI